MSKNRELAKNTAIIFIGTFFTKSVQYFLLPIYTGYLSSSEFGTAELFNNLTYLIVPVIGLQIEHGLFRFLINERRNEIRKKELISSSIFFTLTLNIFCFLIFFLVSSIISYDFKWLLCLNLFLCNLSSIMLQISRGFGDNKKYSIASIVMTVATITSSLILLMIFNFKVLSLLYGSIVGYILGVIYLFCNLKIYNYLSIKCIKKKIIIDIAKYSIPIIPNTLSWWVLSSSDTIIISSTIGLSSVGLLSVAYKISSIGITLYNVFNMSLTESISLHIDEDDTKDYFNKIYNSIGNLFISFTIISISFMPFIFKVLVNREFDNSYGLIPIAMVASIFQILSTMFGTIYIAKKNTKSIALTSFFAATINILVDLALIGFVGVYAAVVSTLISYLILFIYRLIDINKRYLKVQLEHSLIMNLVLLVVVFYPINYIDDIYIKIVIAILAVVSFILINKKSIRYILGIIRKKISQKNHKI